MTSAGLRRLLPCLTALAVVVSAPVATASAAFAARGADKPAAIATLKVTSPNVEVKKKGSDTFKAAKDGAELRQGDTVRTDATGQAEIDYGTDAYTRLDVNTTFTIKKLTEEQGSRQVQGSLDTGQTWNRTATLTESGSFEQEGAGANATVRGTVFTVHCDRPDHCVFLAIEHTTELTGNDGEVHDLTPHVACDSSDGDLCDATRTLSVDELAANDWIQNNLLRDLTERGLGDGPFVPVDVTITVVDGQIVAVEPGPPPAPVATRPGSPRDVSAVVGDGRATVSFLPPLSDGGSPVHRYTVTATPQGGGSSITVHVAAPSASGASSPIEVEGLTNTETYTFTVVAENAIGSGPASEPSAPVTPVGDPPVIDAQPADVQRLSDTNGGNTAGEAVGPGTRVVSQDERTVTFKLRVTNDEGESYWIVFVDLPAPTFGRILAHVGNVDTVVTTTDHYAPDTVFTFDPVEIEPVCSANPTTLADCFTNGNPSEGPDANSGTVAYPGPVTEGPVAGSVQWSDSFTFQAENDQGGVSAPVTVDLVAVDDICTTGEEGSRPGASAVVTCPGS